MTTVFDVPAELLINTVADEFSDNNDKMRQLEVHQTNIFE